MRAFPITFVTAATLLVLPACGTTAKPVPPGARKCSGVTPSGLGFQVLKKGNGAKPTVSDTVKVNYVGYFPKTGKVFDTGNGSAFPVGAVVPGFSEGLQLMQPSGVYRLCVPSKLGYGARAIGPIAANSDLVFQVSLLSVLGR